MWSVGNRRFQERPVSEQRLLSRREREGVRSGTINRRDFESGGSFPAWHLGGTQTRLASVDVLQDTKALEFQPGADKSKVPLTVSETDALKTEFKRLR